MNVNTPNASVDNKDIMEMKTLVHSIKSWEKIIQMDEESKYAACVNMDMKFYRLEQARERLLELAQNSSNIKIPGEDINVRNVADYVMAALRMQEIC